MSEEIIADQLDGFFWCDQQKINRGAAVHSEEAFILEGLDAAIQPEKGFPLN